MSEEEKPYLTKAEFLARKPDFDTEIDLSECIGTETPETHTIQIHGFAVKRDLYSLGWHNQLIGPQDTVLFESCHLSKVVLEAKRLNKEREGNK